MKVLKIVTAVVLALGVAAGCGEPTTETPNTGTDGGNNNNNNNGADGGTQTGGMRINALNVGVTNLATPDEGSGVYGTIILKDDDDNVTDATVTLNGVALNYEGIEGGYPIGKATFTGIGAGSTITVKATRAGETATLSFDCPAEVTLTAPASGTQVAAGESVTLTWTGKLDYTNPVGKPGAAIRTFDSTSKYFGTTPPTAKTDATGTSATLTVPPLSGASDTWVAELRVVGDHKKEGDHEGYCALVRRNQLAPK